MFVAAETWFGIVFVTLVAVCPARLKTTVLGVFLFLMNNIGGNLPVLVNPISKLLGYRSPVLSHSNDHFLLLIDPVVPIHLGTTGCVPRKERTSQWIYWKSLY